MQFCLNLPQVKSFLSFSKLYVSLFRQIWEVFSHYFFEISFPSLLVSSSGTYIMYISVHLISSVQSLSSCPALCDAMDCSGSCHPVHHELLEFTQTHVCWVSDAIQPSQPLSSPSPPAFNLSQHQDPFKRLSSSHHRATVLEFQLPMNIQDWFPLRWIAWISLLAKGPSRFFSNTTVKKHQLFGAQLSL